MVLVRRRWCTGLQGAVLLVRGASQIELIGVAATMGEVAIGRLLGPFLAAAWLCCRWRGAARRFNEEQP